MRRATEKRSDPAGQSAAPHALALHRSPARQRLAALEKEHERLLKEIQKKKLACETSERTAAEAARALEARLRPLRAAFVSALSELRAIFAALLGEDSALNRRDKARVRRAYARILPELLASDPDAAENGEPAGNGARGTSSEGRSAPPEGDAGFSAPRPEKRGTELLRSLFRKLAVALHPDRSQEPAERAALTAVMKEVTRAYEMGDVARLVELERSWLAAPASEPEDDLARRTAVITRSNQELRRQLRGLSAELKELKELIARADGPRRGTPLRGPTPNKDALLGELEREVSEVVGLRDFAQSFLSGEIDLGEFLLGPALAHERDLDPAEELLAELFGERWGGRAPWGDDRRSRSQRGGATGRARRST